MKNRILTLAGVLALLAVVGKYYAVPAIAQTIRSVLIKNIDEKGRNSFAFNVACNETVFGACNTTANSSRSVVPAGMQFVVEDVNLDIAVTAGKQILSAYTVTDGNFAHGYFLAPIYVSSYGGFDHYTVNMATTAYISAGVTPAVIILASGGDLDATQGTITGYLVNLNN